MCILEISEADNSNTGRVPASYPGKKMQNQACSEDNECYSGYCYLRECSTDSPQLGKIGGGGGCQNSDQCYSGYCSSQGGLGKCARDGRMPGKVGDSGDCLSNTRCFSGYCATKCSTDSRVQSKIGGGGGECTLDHHCYSGYCVESPTGNEYGNCAKDGTVQGKFGTGGKCARNEQCESNRCSNSTCQ